MSARPRLLCRTDGRHEFPHLAPCRIIIREDSHDVGSPPDPLVGSWRSRLNVASLEGGRGEDLADGGAEPGLIVGDDHVRASPRQAPQWRYQAAHATYNGVKFGAVCVAINREAAADARCRRNMNTLCALRTVVYATRRL
jgi:hypothetical protein